jgi:hypothetical protein
MANLYLVDFEVVNLTGKAGAKYTYRSGRRQAQVVATSLPNIQTVLNADVTVGAGETIEILHVQQLVSKEGLLT